MRFAIVCCVLGACAARYRYEPAGRGALVVGGVGDASAAPGAAGVSVRAGVRHDVVVRVQLPRAEVVTWTLACPGATASGTLGETMDAYRARRIAELRAERDRQRQAAASIGAAVGGAVLGRATATAQAGPVVATGQVDGAAVGAAAGASTVSDDVQLAPDDVGGGFYTDRATVVPAGDGACVVSVAPPDDGDARGIAGDFEVTRVIDRRAEDRARREVIVGHATDVRASVRGALVAMGADPELRARQRAEAQARAEAEANARAQAEAEARARAQAELDARARIDAQVRARAWDVRGGVVAWLTSCGGDPYRRQREREAQARRDDERRARDEAEAVRVRAQADAIARAEAEREQAALDVRQAQIAILVSLGGVMRPPMPAPVDENPSPGPDGATWVAGHWEWDAPQWVWQPGFWTDGGNGGGDGSAIVDVAGSVADTITNAAATTTPTTTTTITAGGDVRDHRTVTPPAPPPPTPAVRDHRDASPPPAPSSREHRDTSSAPPPSGNRDHRK
jgi:hypothetical protein